MTEVVLSIGSNLGDRAENLREAVRQLEGAVSVTRISSVYETEPQGLADQPWFLNIACCGETAMEPEALLDRLKDIERQMGRRAAVRYGPRPIDLDIITMGDSQLHTDRLDIPHPRWSERLFVLAPLAEICPGLIEPSSGLSVKELAKMLDKDQAVRRVGTLDERGQVQVPKGAAGTRDAL